MSGEQNLQTLLGTLSAKLVDGVHVFVTLPDNRVPSNLQPRMVFRETEGTTLILLKSEAEAAGLDHDFACRMITLDVHSSLDAVGFIARIAAELTAHGMAVNPVSAFYHDHLFVPEERAQEALDLLGRLAMEAAGDG
jgi:hypothetical protein